MRCPFISAVTVVLVVTLAAQSQSGGRYGFDVLDNKYPQKSPEDTLASAIKAIETKKIEYLMAQLADPTYVDKKVEEYKKLYKGKEESRTLLAFERLAKETEKYFQDDPILVKDLQR